MNCNSITWHWKRKNFCKCRKCHYIILAPNLISLYHQGRHSNMRGRAHCAGSWRSLSSACFTARLHRVLPACSQLSHQRPPGAVFCEEERRAVFRWMIFSCFPAMELKAYNGTSGEHLKMPVCAHIPKWSTNLSCSMAESEGGGREAYRPQSNPSALSFSLVPMSWAQGEAEPSAAHGASTSVPHPRCHTLSAFPAPSLSHLNFESIPFCLYFCLETVNLPWAQAARRWTKLLFLTPVLHPPRHAGHLAGSRTASPGATWLVFLYSGRQTSQASQASFSPGMSIKTPCLSLPEGNTGSFSQILAPWGTTPQGGHLEAALPWQHCQPQVVGACGQPHTIVTWQQVSGCLNPIVTWQQVSGCNTSCDKPPSRSCRPPPQWCAGIPPQWGGRRASVGRPQRGVRGAARRAGDSEAPVTSPSSQDTDQAWKMSTLMAPTCMLWQEMERSLCVTLCEGLAESRVLGAWGGNAALLCSDYTQHFIFHSFLEILQAT